MPFDAHDELAEFLADDYELPDTPDADKPLPEIGGRDDANRVLRAIARAESKIREYEESARIERERIDRFVTDRTAGLRREIEWRERTIEAFMRAQFAATGTKTLPLPAGELRIRPAQPTIEIVDVRAAADWLETADFPSFVEYVPKIKGGELKKQLQPGPVAGPVGDDGREPHDAVTKDGEPALGVRLRVPVTESFTYTTAGPADRMGSDPNKENNQ